MNWKEVRSRIFTRSNEIVEGSNCLFYKVLGYKFLNSKLILYFHDCKEVYTFEVMPVEGSETEHEVVETRYWTKSYENNDERLLDLKTNDADYDKEKPEIKEVDKKEKK
jgi:hypothetical protein